MKKILVLVSVTVIIGSIQLKVLSATPFDGKWKSDKEKTLKFLIEQKSLPDDVTPEQFQELMQYGRLIIEFKDNKGIFTLDDQVSETTFTIIEQSDNKRIVQYPDGPTHIHQLEGDYMWISAIGKEFEGREYFKKIE